MVFFLSVVLSLFRLNNTLPDEITLVIRPIT